ncbi:hypothetical protein K503DRAFT_771984 [Rhizopogon vinicolor AM-OR11-026]|uniref:Molybdopterin binding oxidoreductase n=1 Tax=Rhizopogon vinicolor AM-OR11-026 TaxID=1314800 RepID=A0A1B7MWI7_9AGAM|nr:hypothetical protein K503DRAFT_771984 [Rhizopogon vinicolor AM-OR11-026]
MGKTDLRVLGDTPLNAEPPCLVELTRHTITPLHLVYARNHSEIKNLASEADTYTVKIDGEMEGMQEKTLSVKDMIVYFPRIEVVATLICAGNRRAKMQEKTGKAVRGILWSEGTIANARWAGVPLRDILIAAGVSEQEDAQRGFHVCFVSAVAPCQDDTDYGGSIPLEKAMAKDGDVMLAYEMNDEPLTPDHGFPLRVVVPGYFGMRWVKWVDRITISRKESPNFYQQRDYRMLPECVSSAEMANKEDWWGRTPAMQELNCNSVVAHVQCLTDSCPDQKTLKATGYAYSHSPISRVEISADGGETWHEARITYQEGRWSWSLWECELKVDIDLDALELASPGRKNGRSKTKITVISRAFDESGSAQDTNCRWNLRGVGFCGVGDASVEVFQG